MKRVVILQPSYIPWLGHFNMMMNADVFVYFDNVQYTRRDWRNRNYILTKQNEKKLLSIPVYAKGNFKKKIKEIQINYLQNKWIKQHLWLVKESYKNYPFFIEIYEILSSHLQSNYNLLANLTIDMNIAFANYLGINAKIVRSSEINSNYKFENASEHLLEICKYYETSHYLSGPASKAYLDAQLFEKHDIEVKFHDYTHPLYEQDELQFVPFLSILDLLFRYGKKSKSIIYKQQF